MSKRFTPLKEFGRSSKKPKLDININRGRPSTSKAAAKTDIHGPAENEVPDPWDDGEDDVILLATQVAETEIAAKAKEKPQKSMEITDSEITFCDFEPKTQQHSTQHPIDPDVISQMFEDDDDDFALLTADIEKQSEAQFSGFKKPTAPFKKPEPPKPSSKQNIRLDEQPTSSKYVTKPQLDEQPTSSKYSSTSHRPPDANIAATLQGDKTDASTAARRQLASEKQIQFLMENMAALRKENEALTKNLTDVQDAMQNKTGEVNMLRSELKQTKKQMDDMKMQNIFQKESVNVESKQKIEELSRAIKSKDSALELKNMECAMLKLRQADETKDRTAIEPEIPPQATANVEQIDIELASDSDSDEEYFQIPPRDPDHSDSNSDDAYEPLTPEWEQKEKEAFHEIDVILSKEIYIDDSLPIQVESSSTELTEDIYKKTEILNVYKSCNRLFQTELENLQLILGQINLDLEDFTDKTSEALIASVLKIFTEFDSYVQRLDFGFNETVLWNHEYDIIEDKSTRPPGCLHKNSDLFEKEKTMNMRRYVALLSTICEKSMKATFLLLNATHEEKPLLQKGIDAITDLGFSFNLFGHFGVLEAFALLLRSMLLHINPEATNMETYLNLLFELLKTIVFTRPTPWVFRELSYSVLELVRRFPYVVSMFCKNSPRDTFELDRRHNIYRFSNETCFLQIYCGLVESTFPLYTHLENNQFRLLNHLCLNHIRFVFYMITDPPDFIQKILEEEEDDDLEYDFDLLKEFGFMEIDVTKLTTEKKEKTPPPTSATGPTPSCQLPQQPTSFEEPDVINEGPSTSKAAAALRAKEIKTAAAKESTKKDNESTTTDSPEKENDESAKRNSSEKENPNEPQCDCFVQLCLSAVTLIWLSLRQWLRTDQLVETRAVGSIAQVAVHLLYIMFYDYYIPSLFRDDEDLLKHFLYLIINWCLEHSKDLELTELHLSLLNKLKKSHILPKLPSEEEPKPENVLADVMEWYRLTNDKEVDPTKIDPEEAIRVLDLENFIDEKTFFTKEEDINEMYKDDYPDDDDEEYEGNDENMEVDAENATDENKTDDKVIDLIDELSDDSDDMF